MYPCLLLKCKISFTCTTINVLPGSYYYYTGSTDRLPPDGSSRTNLTVVERFAAFNSIQYMSRHWGAMRKSPDADLDIEHHIPSSRAMLDNSKKARGRIYCYRLLLLSECRANSC